MRLLPLVLAFCAIFGASPAAAWWDYPHATVARIALANVKPETRRAVFGLLRDGALLDTPQCPVDTIGEASTWADCIKKLGPRFAYASAWHYQNVEVCKPFDLTIACRDGNCVSAQIDRDVKLLRDRRLPRVERLTALLFLIHFVGDLHQPLHAGDDHDLGGNKVAAAYGIASGRINLHMIWDGYLAERAITTPPAGVSGLLAGVSRAERRRLAAGSVADWSRESWEAARDHVYAPVAPDACAAPPTQVMLGNQQIEAEIPIVRKQVLKGGLRLARLLDEALG